LQRLAARQPSESTLVAVLFGSIFFDSVGLKMFGGLFNIRPSFVVAAIVFPILAWRWLVTRQPLQRTPLLPAMLGLDTCFFLSTAINWQSPVLLRGFITCTLLLVNITFFGVLYWHARRPPRATQMLRFVVAMAASYAVIGVVVLLLYQVGFGPARYLVEFRTLGNWTMGGAQQDALTPRPWFLEPNIGTYLAAIGVMAFAMTLITVHRERWFYGMSAGAIFTGVLLTYSRGAWIGAIVGAATVLALLIWRRGIIPIRPLPLLGLSAVLAATLLVVMTVVPSVKTVLIARLENILNTGAGTGHGRLVFWARITEDALHRPILGHGANAYQLLIPAPLVAENAVVEIFHTSGIVGLALYVAITVMVIMLFWKAFASGGNLPATRAAAIIPLGGYLSLLVGSQMNPSFWGNMYWAVFGLAIALLAPAAVGDGPSEYGKGDPDHLPIR
jgi:O-antigen ligase